jgi:hypothetical protein
MLSKKMQVYLRYKEGKDSFLPVGYDQEIMYMIGGTLSHEGYMDQSDQ